MVVCNTTVADTLTVIVELLQIASRMSKRLTPMTGQSNLAYIYLFRIIFNTRSIPRVRLSLAVMYTCSSFQTLNTNIKRNDYGFWHPAAQRSVQNIISARVTVI